MSLAVLLALSACTGKDSAGDSDTADSRPIDTGPDVIDDTADTNDTSDTGEDTSATEAAYEAFYAVDTLQTLTLRLDANAIAGLQADPDTYVTAGFEHDGTILSAVGVKLRGSETWDQKPGFSIKLQEFDGPEYLGLERMVLDNQWDDAAQIRAVLAYEAVRNAGLVAPHANFAEVYVNDEYLGLYANIEVIDEKFAGRAFPDANGDLYEGGDGADFYEQGVTFFNLVDGDGDENLLRLAWEAVQPPYEVDYYADVQTAIDMDQYQRYVAWQMMVGAADGYPYEQNDYYIQVNPTSHQVSFVPWALDKSWDAGWTADPNRGFISVYCEIDDGCSGTQSAAIAAALDRVTGMGLSSRAGALYTLTDDAMNRDERKQLPSAQVDSARTSFLATLDGWPDRVRTAVGL